jgi:hypothetical protein
MAIKACRECGKQVSTEAKACPHCGAAAPTGPSVGQQAASIGCLTLVVAVGALVWIGSQSDTSEKNAERRIDSRTGRPYLDFAKPLWAIKGAPACPTTDEIDAFRKQAPNTCATIPADWMVIEMERSGILLPAYRVRLVGLGKDVIEAWVPIEGLRN